MSRPASGPATSAPADAAATTTPSVGSSSPARSLIVGRWGSTLAKSAPLVRKTSVVARRRTSGHRTRPEMSGHLRGRPAAAHQRF